MRPEVVVHRLAVASSIETSHWVCAAELQRLVEHVLLVVRWVFIEDTGVAVVWLSHFK